MPAAKKKQTTEEAFFDKMTAYLEDLKKKVVKMGQKLPSLKNPFASDASPKKRKTRSTSSKKSATPVKSKVSSKRTSRK